MAEVGVKKLLPLEVRLGFKLSFKRVSVPVILDLRPRAELRTSKDRFEKDDC